MDVARLVRVIALVGLAGLVGLGVVVPGQLQTLAGQVSTRLLEDVPEPVIVAVALVLGVVLWFVLFRWLLTLCYRCWRVVAGWLYRVMTIVLPESPLVKFAAGAMVMIFVVIVIVGVLPGLLGSLSESGEGPASYPDRLSSAALNEDWQDIVEGDAARGEPSCGASPGAGATDRDGDGLPDQWERDGETPGGAALPNASPTRKDLYVQVNYGADVAPLSEAERSQLRQVWAEMPVDNPDDSTGIRLHLDTGTAGGGGLGETAVFESGGERDRYYTDARLGPRRCVYHQVVYGKLQMGSLAGYASMPGYSAIVDGSRQPDYEGGVDFRVALTTHELLHNVAGRVDGRTHTTAGWLAGGPDNEYLSTATARDLTESGLFGPAS